CGPWRRRSASRGRPCRCRRRRPACPGARRPPGRGCSAASAGRPPAASRGRSVRCRAALGRCGVLTWSASWDGHGYCGYSHPRRLNRTSQYIGVSARPGAGCLAGPMGTDGKNDGGFRRDGARDDDGDGARRDGAGSTRLRGNGVRGPGGDARPGGAGDRRDDGPGPAREVAARRDAAVRAAVEQGLLAPGRPLVALLDVTGIRRSAAALRAAFAAVTPPGTPVLHAFAVKATPLVPVLRLLYEEGIGAEVASPGELALARAAGVPARHTVLDSPAKTPDELRRALSLGIAVNVDNPQELARLDGLIPPAGPRAPVGLRVNPQVGAGAIEALSTATATSKFGVALRDAGAREWVVRAYLDRPWLTRLHAHTGSQGVALSLMARGVAEAYALAEEINRRAGRRQVDTLDIGGGLPVNFASDA